MIDKKNKNFIKNQSLKDYPNETCGFIVEDKGEFRCIPCKNIAQNSIENFKISPKEYLEIKRKYMNILYIYHSHTNNNDNFSELDKNCSENLCVPIILYYLNTDLIKIYEPLNIKKEYTGRFYKHGEYDCFKLIEEFYKKEKSIEFKYDKEFYKKSLEEMDIKNELIKFYNHNNFNIIDNKELELHDILLIDAFGENKPKHFALYMGDNKILHSLFTSSLFKISKHCFANDSFINKIYTIFTIIY
jgi:proteasome lid subunit RPN8/RPN11